MNKVQGTQSTSIPCKGAILDRHATTVCTGGLAFVSSKGDTVHAQPATQIETPGGSERQGRDSSAHATEGGLVGRVAQVGRQIVRSLLHPNGQGHEEGPTAAAEAEADGDQGEQLDQEQAVGVVAGIAEVAGTEVEAGEKSSSQVSRHGQGPEYRTLAEVAAEVAAEAAQANPDPLYARPAGRSISGMQTAVAPVPAGPAPAGIQTGQQEVTDQAEVPALAAEAGQVEESGYESDTGDQDEAPPAATIDIADTAPEDLQPIVVNPSFAAAAAVRANAADQGDGSLSASDHDVVLASTEAAAVEGTQAADESDLTAPVPVIVIAPDEAAAADELAAGDETDHSQDGTAAQVQPLVAAEVASIVDEPLPEQAAHGPGQHEAAADTVVTEVAVEELRAPAYEHAADVQPAAELPEAADVPVVEAEVLLVLTDESADDEQLGAEPLAAAEAGQTEEAVQDAPTELACETSHAADGDADLEADPPHGEVPGEAPADAAKAKHSESEPETAPEEVLLAAASAAVQHLDSESAGRGRVDAEGELGSDEERLAAAAAAAVEELLDGNPSGGAHDQGQLAGAEAEEAGGKGPLLI